jgi:hypothetical protein
MRAGVEEENMKRITIAYIASITVTIAAILGFLGVTIYNAQSAQGQEGGGPLSDFDSVIQENAQEMITEGRQTFRFDTFGDEAFWGDTLRLHQAIAGEGLGGVGAGVSPNTALAVGLKVDVDALPENLRNDPKEGKVDLDDPATTLALLQLNAVVGVTGFFDDQGNLNLWASSVLSATPL